jgi:hypothetical protein
MLMHSQHPGQEADKRAAVLLGWQLKALRGAISDGVMEGVNVFEKLLHAPLMDITSEIHSLTKGLQSLHRVVKSQSAFIDEQQVRVLWTRAVSPTLQLEGSSVS